MHKQPKAEILSRIRRARSSHIKWRSYAYGMLAGLEVTEEHTPIDCHNCGFGQWYYEEGQRLFGHMDTYEGLEIPHKVMHQVYDKIFDLAQRGRLDEAIGYEDKLNALSRQLLEALDLLEQEVKETLA